MMIITLLFAALSFAQDPHGQRLNTPSYYQQAYGELSQKDPHVIHHWPVHVQSIGHTNASYQGYGGQPYFHHGLDIRANAGEDVLVTAGGKVVNVENYDYGPLYWEIAILDDEGFIWQYHHVDHNSIPSYVHDAFKSGGRIEAGTKIGEVVNWPITTYGERYHHIHLNVLDGQRNFLSPFLFLQPLGDKQTPVIKRIGLMKNGKEVNGTTVRGSYSVFAEVHDLILHQQFIVPPHNIEVELDGGPVHTVWKFETLPGGADEEKDVEVFYVPSMVCGNYSCRRPVFDLGFRWNFPTLPGQHQLKLRVSDFEGNTSVQDFHWVVE